MNQRNHTRQHSLGKRQRNFFLILSLIGCILIYIVKENGHQVIKGSLYTIIICYTAFYDNRYHEIPDFIHMVIVLIGCINCIVISSSIGILIAAPFLMVAIKQSGSIGGGDIKYMIANGFLLGFPSACYACILGLLLLILFNIKKYRKKDCKVAMAPYLSVGCFIAFLL